MAILFFFTVISCCKGDNTQYNHYYQEGHKKKEKSMNWPSWEMCPKVGDGFHIVNEFDGSVLFSGPTEETAGVALAMICDVLLSNQAMQLLEYLRVLHGPAYYTRIRRSEGRDRLRLWASPRWIEYNDCPF